MTLKRKLATVGECIAYIESTGYKLSHRFCRTWYVFRNPARAQGQVLTFTLTEMRDAWANGF